MKILMVTSELDGIVKTGGLADFASALPKALIERGHEVKVILPKYKNAFFPKPLKSEPLYFNLNHFTQYGSLVYHANLPTQRASDNFSVETKDYFIPIRLIEHHDFFTRNGIYGNYNENIPYPDNALRYAFLCKAAIEMCLQERWIPDIIHCNDWQTALLPYYLKEHYPYNSEQKEYLTPFKKTKTLLTIHNGEYQGKAEKKWLDTVGIMAERFTSELMEEYGLINVLKCGIIYADEINTVSRGYCEELLQPETSHQNLWIYLNKRRGRFTGILNGCDYSLWNPATDSLLPHHFSSSNMSGKALCKIALQTKMRLPLSVEINSSNQNNISDNLSSSYNNREIPLLGLVSRLTAQKGFDYLIPALERLLYEDAPVQIAILGSGEPDYGSWLHHLERRYPNKMSFVNGYDNALAHLIEAGSDFFMMPSKFEPCGLNQLYSLAYGTIPIIRETGGLKDTVIGLLKKHENSHLATGISFDYPDTYNCYEALKQAIALYLNDKILYQEMQKRGMDKRFTWQKCAEQYEILYRNMIKS